MPLYSDNSKSLLRGILQKSNHDLLAVGYEKISVSTIKSLTVPTGATYALITVESSLTTPAIRYLELGDKTPPTSTDGIQRSNLDAFDVNGYSNLLNFRAIQVGVGTHTLHVQYYK